MSGSSGAAASAASASRVTTSHGVSIPVGAVSRIVTPPRGPVGIPAPPGVPVYIPGSPAPVTQPSRFQKFLDSIQKISGVIGTVTQAVGQFQQSRTQAAIADYNAQVLKQQAQLVREAGKLEQRTLIKRNRAFTSRQVALFAKAKIALNGSALEVLSEDLGILEEDRLIAAFNNENKARSIEAGVPFQELQADSLRNEGYARAGSTLLTQLPNFLNTTFGR